MQRSAEDRSEKPCPVCGQHELALDMPPRIDVLGVQPYSDLIGMGDRSSEGSVGIICRSCGTYWRDLDAFERNEPEVDGGDAAADEDEAPLAAG